VDGDRARTAADLALELRVARDEAGGIELCRQIVEAIDKGTLEAGGRDLAGLLDECFVTAYHAGPDARGLATCVRELYWQTVRSDHEARDAFLRSEIRIRTNFAFLDD
jgi:hypothetical protein